MSNGPINGHFGKEMSFETLLDYRVIKGLSLWDRLGSLTPVGKERCSFVYVSEYEHTWYVQYVGSLNLHGNPQRSYGAFASYVLHSTARCLT